MKEVNPDYSKLVVSEDGQVVDRKEPFILGFAVDKGHPLEYRLIAHVFQDIIRRFGVPDAKVRCVDQGDGSIGFEATMNGDWGHVDEAMFDPEPDFNEPYVIPGGK